MALRVSLARPQQSIGFADDEEEKRRRIALQAMSGNQNNIRIQTPNDEWNSRVGFAMNKAREAGYSEDEVQRAALVEQVRENVRRSIEQADSANVARQEQAPTKKERSGWIKWLPVIAGTAGTIAAAPFTGGASLAGTAAILGGAGLLSAAGGEFAAQKFNKEETDYGNIAQEGLISGAASAIPVGKVFQAGKGFLTGVGRKGVSEGAEELTEQALRRAASREGVTSFPIKTVDDILVGRAQPETARRMFVNPTVGEVADSADDLARRGFSTTGRVRTAPGATTQEPSTNVIAQMTGKRTRIPMQSTGEVVDEIPGGIRVNQGAPQLEDEVAEILQPAGSSNIPVGRFGQGFLRQSTIAPSSTIGDASGQNQLIKLARQFPELRGSGFKKFQNVEKVIGKQVDEVDTLLKGSSGRISQGDFIAKIEDIATSIPDDLDRKYFGRIYNRAVGDTFSNNMPSNISAIEVNALRRQINKQAGTVMKKLDRGGQLTPGDNAVLMLRDVLGDTVGDLAGPRVQGAVKGLNRNISTLMDAIPEFKKLSESGIQVLGTNIPLLSKGTTRAFQTTADLTGRAITNPMARFGAGNLTKQVVGRSLLDDGSVPLEQPNIEGIPLDGQEEQGYGFDLTYGNDTDQQTVAQLISAGYTDADEISQILAGGGMDAMGGAGGQGGAPQGGMQYSSQELFNAAVAAFQAGDAKSSDQFLQLAEMAAGFEEQALKARGGAAGGGLNVTKVTAQQYGLAQAGVQSLQGLKQLIARDPGSVGRSAVPGGSLPVVGGYIRNAAGVGEYDALGYNIADTLIRLRTGAQANESEIKGYANKIMPRAGDSQQVVQLKLRQLEDSFNSVLARAQSSGGGSSFEDEIMQMLGGGDQSMGGGQYGYGFGY